MTRFGPVKTHDSANERHTVSIDEVTDDGTHRQSVGRVENIDDVTRRARYPAEMTRSDRRVMVKAGREVRALDDLHVVAGAKECGGPPVTANPGQRVMPVASREDDRVAGSVTGVRLGQPAARSQCAAHNSRYDRRVDIRSVDDVHHSVFRPNHIGLPQAGAQRCAEAVAPIGHSDGDDAGWQRYLRRAEDHDDGIASARHATP